MNAYEQASIWTTTNGSQGAPIDAAMPMAMGNISAAAAELVTRLVSVTVPMKTTASPSTALPPASRGQHVRDGIGEAAVGDRGLQAHRAGQDDVGLPVDGARWPPWKLRQPVAMSARAREQRGVDAGS